MNIGFLMQGYGGCFNPPCRQRPNVLIRLISRALPVRQSAMEFARHEDKVLKVFWVYEAIQRRISVRGSATDTPLNCLQTIRLQTLSLIAQFKTCSASTTASNSTKQEFLQLLKLPCHPIPARLLGDFL